MLDLCSFDARKSNEYQTGNDTRAILALLGGRKFGDVSNDISNINWTMIARVPTYADDQVIPSRERADDN